MTAPTPTPPAPAAAPKADLVGNAKVALPIVAGAFLLGGFIGLQLARKFAVPPLPRAPQPCGECAQRRAMEVEQRIAADREAARQAVATANPTGPTIVPTYTEADLDPASEQPGFDQTKVENPKTFSPVGKAPDGG